MPRDSSGNYSLPPGYLAVTGQTVLASQHNPPLEDIGTSLTASYVRDGRAPMLGNVPMNSYRVTGAGDASNPQDYVTLSQVQAFLSAISSVPSGLMAPYVISSATAPAGWLFANGQTVSRVTFASLWAAVSGGNNIAATELGKIVGQFGPGDGSTTFSLPNLYADDGYFIRPMATGRTIGSSQADEIESHTHSGDVIPAGAHTHNLSAASAGGGGQGISIQNSVTVTSTAAYTQAVGDHDHGLTINATGGAETRPKNIAYPVIIKT